MLSRNRFAVHRSRWPAAAVVTAASAFNSILGFVQSVAYGKRISRTAIDSDPVFVLGHWRSGTTLLHELLTLDDRHAAPATWDCFAPHHFLLTRRWLPRMLESFVRDRRPMDNMRAGLDYPQEDEFALSLLGEPSPYERIAFPGEAAAGKGSLDLRGLTEGERRRWERTFDRFLRALTMVNDGRRLILKSPPHTARIPVLLKRFPHARFVHLVRNPYSVYPSTLHLWRHLTATHNLRLPAWEQLPDQIIGDYLTLFARLEAEKPLIPQGQFHELKYEDLIADPLQEVSAIYHNLKLGDFKSVRPKMESYWAGIGGYETNRYVITPEEVRIVTAQWGDIVRRYDYPIRTT